MASKNTVTVVHDEDIAGRCQYDVDTGTKTRKCKNKAHYTLEGDIPEESNGNFCKVHADIMVHAYSTEEEVKVCSQLPAPYRGPDGKLSIDMRMPTHVYEDGEPAYEEDEEEDAEGESEDEEKASYFEADKPQSKMMKKSCGHSCCLESTEKCCHCEDKRPLTDKTIHYGGSYMSDFTEESREFFYCPHCNKNKPESDINVQFIMELLKKYSLKEKKQIWIQLGIELSASS